MDGEVRVGTVVLGMPVPRANLPCGNIDPVGITSTPVVDRGASTLYVTGLTTPNADRTKTYKIASTTDFPAPPVCHSTNQLVPARRRAEVSHRRGYNAKTRSPGLTEMNCRIAATNPAWGACISASRSP